MPFGIAVVIVGLAIWRIAGWRHAATIDTLKHRLQLRDDQIAEFQRRPPGPSEPTATPGHSLKEPHEAAPLSVQSTERAFVGKSVTPHFLMELCQNKTGVQADSTVGIYVGKWMQVSGAIVDVEREGLSIQVTLAISPNPETAEHGGQRILIGLLFTAHTAHLEALQPGDPLTSVGKIKRIKADTLNLNECEFVSAE